MLLAQLHHVMAKKFIFIPPRAFRFYDKNVLLPLHNPLLDLHNHFRDLVGSLRVEMKVARPTQTKDTSSGLLFKDEPIKWAHLLTH